MSNGKKDPVAISRRTVLGAASATPLACGARKGALNPPDDLVALCGRWLASDFKTDELARRWAALEILAASGYDYFRMDERQRRGLPMAPEMEAIERELDGLAAERKALFKTIAARTPRDLHEAASLLLIASRMDVHEPGPTAPLVRRAMAYLSEATCPGCGAPYLPPSLPPC